MLPNFILFIESLSRYGHFPTFVHSAQLGQSCLLTHAAAGWEEEEHPDSDF